MIDDDTIPSSESYRGVPIHLEQPRSRVESVVLSEIDLVYDHAQDLRWLREFFVNPANAPEGRLLAAVTVRAGFDLAVKERRERPSELSMADFDLAAGYVKLLSSKRARSPLFYGLRFDPGTAPGQKPAARRDQPLQQDDGGTR